MANIIKLLITLALLTGPMMVANAAKSLEQNSAFTVFQSDAEPGTEEGDKKPDEEAEPDC